MINLYNGDCLEVMDKLIEEGVKVDLVVTSPPYDDIKNYSESLVWNESIWMEVIEKLYKLLNKNGVIIWVVGDRTKNGSESGTSFKQALHFMKCGFNLHDTMIYRKKNYTPLTHKRYEQEFEYMFCFSKGKPKTFNAIKIPCKYAGTEKWGKSTYYKTDDDKVENGKKTIISDNKIKGNIFEYYVGSSKTGKVKHPAMFPIELSNDMILSWSNENDLVMDIFMGSGQTGLSSIINNRNFIGIEKVEKYFKIAQERIENEGGKISLF